MSVPVSSGVVTLGNQWQLINDSPLLGRGYDAWHVFLKRLAKVDS